MLKGFGHLKRIRGASGAAKSYGIILTHYGEKRRTVIAHELMQVSQYERLGGIAALVRSHLPDFIANGYRRSILEDEAYSREDEIVQAQAN